MDWSLPIAFAMFALLGHVVLRDLGLSRRDVENLDERVKALEDFNREGGPRCSY